MSKKKDRKTGAKRKSRKKKRKNKKLIPVAIVLFICFLSLIVLGIVYFVDKRVFHLFDDNVFSEKYVVRGIDVSRHNIIFDWNRLRESNIYFVFIKSTEGIKHNDSAYSEHYRLAKEAGLKVGTYHFYTFGLDGEQQAKHFIRSSQIVSGDVHPAIDVEHSFTNKFCDNKDAYASMINELKRMENRLFKYFNVRPIIYTNKESYRLYIKDNFPNNPVWICDLHHKPHLADDQWIIWQFSHTGQLAGVEGNVDLNYFRYSFMDFQHLLIP